MTYSAADVASAIALKNGGGTTLQSFSYSDSPAGTILSETDTPSSAQSPATYAYDAQGRVTSMTPGSGTAHSYGFDASSNLTALPTGGTGSYDKNGELTSATLSGTTTSYSYNADGERLSAAQGGSTTASGTWNGAAQLTSYDSAAGDMVAAGYDGDGLRAAATYGASTQGYVWNEVSSLPLALMDSGNAYIYTGGVAPAEQVNLATGSIMYLVTDSLGSVRGVVNSSGTLTATTSYDAWGNPETTGGLTVSTPFGYAGGYTDPTGLVYLLNRYYDPATGQFTSVDPALAQTLQPYTYANANPVSLTDPTGKWTWSWRNWLFSFWAWGGHFVFQLSQFQARMAMQGAIWGVGGLVGWLCTVVTGGWVAPLCITAATWITGMIGYAASDWWRFHYMTMQFSYGVHWWWWIPYPYIDHDWTVYR
jgi:RHS repeat-associated protein